MTTLTESWTRKSAWAWLRSSSHPFARTIQTNPALVEWYDPRPLPAIYRSLPSSKHGCLLDAMSAAEFDSTLAIALGFQFRLDAPERGIPHVWALGGEWHRSIIDLSTVRLGEPFGYLGSIASPQTLGILARSNGLEIPEHLFERHQRLNP